MLLVLMAIIAIGELQKHAGTDTRITVPADILNPDHPPLTDVWRSWEATNHELSGNFTGRPLAPDYASKDRRFISWLVSGASSAVLMIRKPRNESVMPDTCFGV
jgi:hypothetical protein